MYSRYEPVTQAEADDRPDRDFPAPSTPDPTKNCGSLDGLRGLLGGTDLKPLDLGDMLLLAVIALLVLEGGDDTDLIIVLAVALLIGI